MNFRTTLYSFMRSRLNLVVLLVLFATASEAPAQIIGLGYPDGHNPSSGASGISNDGTVVTGDMAKSGSYQAFRWTSESGMVGLGVPGGANYYSVSTAISGDGSTVTGYHFSDFGQPANLFRWTSAVGAESLGQYSATEVARGYGASFDGSVLVGSANGPSGNYSRAFTWTDSSGFSQLPGFGFGSFPDESVARAVSDDGTVIVGTAHDGLGNHPVRWVNGVLEKLGDAGHAHGVSNDGSVVVGYLARNGNTEQFRWTSETGMVSLGALENSYHNRAKDVSGDGSIVVGEGTGGATVWTSTGGLQKLYDALQANGTDMSHWLALYSATAISPDGTKIVGFGLNKFHISEAYVATLVDPNAAPMADAGDNQSIRAGDVVSLDGSASFDDNTATPLLNFEWSFVSKPASSSATLDDSTSVMPSFTADVAGTYVLELVVTDEGGLASDSAFVEISSNNLAPIAVATSDVSLSIIGDVIALDGAASSDPEGDAITYQWSITSAPVGSTAGLVGSNSASPTLTPDVEGTYVVSLEVSDFLGAGTPAEIELTATLAVDFAEIVIVQACDQVTALGAARVTTRGNQKALCNFLNQAVRHIQNGRTDKAIDKLNKAVERTDGWALRGSADGNGKGRDWVTDEVAQIGIYELLTLAIEAIEY